MSPESTALTSVKTSGMSVETVVLYYDAKLEIGSVERGMPHSQVQSERTDPIIMAGCMAHARNGRISTSGLKSDVTLVFIDPDYLKDAKILAIRII